MTAFTYMNAAGDVIILNPEDGPKSTRCLEVREQRTPLTPELLRQLAYHCALYYREMTGLTALLPAGFEPLPNDDDEDLIG